uniref:Putative secreted protein n=1 Tax=Ixodes ricinus TaxID=34613 RepID=A0A6B0U7F3_IXORI
MLSGKTLGGSCAALWNSALTQTATAAAVPHQPLRSVALPHPVQRPQPCMPKKERMQTDMQARKLRIDHTQEEQPGTLTLYF